MFLFYWIVFILLFILLFILNLKQNNTSLFFYFYNSWIEWMFLFFLIFFLISIFWIFESLPVNSLFFTQTYACTSFFVFLWPYFYLFLIITIITLIYSMSFNSSELFLFLFFLFLIIVAGVGLFIADSMILFFIFYEMLLIPSFLILYLYAKTRKAIEAAFLMFFWTQFGAIFLIFNFIYIYISTSSFYFSSLQYFSFSSFQSTVLFFNFLIGFGVKFPIWPFYDWLPKAHVEASTNFSIFLSGVLVKFAFFGLFKCLFCLPIFINLYLIYIYLIVGLVDVAFKLYYQIDLKKLIAFSTVVEMHWLTLSIINGQSIFWIISASMLISHALISSVFFLLIDSVTRRFKTRLITELSGLQVLTPTLYFFILLTLITFLGFPGSYFFIAEFLFFSFLLDINFLLTFILLILLYLFAASSFFKNWFFLLFGYSFFFSNYKYINDLDLKEIIVFGFFLILLYLLGFSNQLLF